ncbi:glycoside hydrolase family 31 protein [Streptomyces muensis]|uniref:Glycoside hydrolase family 31 protein n=1 Tax=Streptomyces muensis TaxID=1077944 RepID=A0A9X1TJ95_STRM4|nr:glycoside hydrolase family 31 protein [Streptomyces muensis]MCF1592344.1 glycoside hydrolase family 31 protein [Streptomyces muensis]
MEHSGDEVELPLEEDERWWGGAAEDGLSMPFGARPFTRDLGRPVRYGFPDAAPSNQGNPLLVSTRGRVIWSDRPFEFAFEEGVLRVSGREVLVGRGGDTLREAYRSAARRFFPPSGRAPARQLFTGPQYNTWIELPHTPTQEAVLRLADDLLAAGMPPGVLMIDDLWSPDYGTWRFDRARFPDPRAMVRHLHDRGFAVMLWVVPFVSPDSAVFRQLEAEGLLIRDRHGDIAIRRWWNGFSALLDLTNPSAVSWMTSQLDALIAETGVDGFKFDAGDIRDYRADDILASPAEPVDLCEAWARVGLRYPFNEYRACWRMGGQPLGQRLQDKPPLWGPAGIGSLIPEMLAQGMTGYPFTCPDMIGGGEIEAMGAQGATDQEFFVRYAQIAALSPMMQFSVVPSRVLDDVHLAAVREALAVRASVLPMLLRLVDEAATTGEPIVRPMAYHADGLDDITDQFFLGPDLVVAPVLVKAATERAVVLPAGRWRGEDGTVVDGPATVTVRCDLRRIPRFERITDV